MLLGYHASFSDVERPVAEGDYVTVDIEDVTGSEHRDPFHYALVVL